MDQFSPPPGRLFLVDDDPAVLAALRFRFEADGYNVVAMTSGEDLIEDPPLDDRSCIVIDQRLPGLTGLETVTRLRAAGVETPAILITSNPSHAVQRGASKLAISIIEKPLIGDALTRRRPVVWPARMRVKQ